MVPLGIARAAIDEVIKLAAGKTPTASTSLLRDRVMAQGDIARAEARLRSGRAFLFETIGEIWDDVRGGRIITLEQRILAAMAAAHAATSATEAVDLVCGVAGTTPLYERSPLERYFRDAHAAVRHMQISPARYEVVGRGLLGLDLTGALL
jgi:alkylation response protein AidB-like acyl-CoA dehydrogenase